MARRMGAQYAECSSKEMVGVHDVFDQAVHLAVKNEENATRGRKDNGSGGVSTKRKRNCKLL